MLRNITKKTVISKNIRVANGFLDNILGMILRKNSSGLILHTHFGIHTFFMRESIDVLILDMDKICVKLKRNLRPNSIYVWNPKFNTVIELPVGILKINEVEIGDKLDF